MQFNPSETDLHELDIKVLLKFLYTLNITRNHVSAYPENHPIIETSAIQLLGLLQKLFERIDRITLGVARDVLLIGGDAIERGNAVYKNLANALFECGVASLSLNQQVT